MTGLDLISKRLGDLSKLPEKRDTIFLGDVRKEFRANLQSFIVGETLGVQDGKPVIGKNLYNTMQNISARRRKQGINQFLSYLSKR